MIEAVGTGAGFDAFKYDGRVEHASTAIWRVATLRFVKGAGADLETPTLITISVSAKSLQACDPTQEF
jgi:hypothetical protein